MWSKVFSVSGRKNNWLNTFETQEKKRKIVSCRAGLAYFSRIFFVTGSQLQMRALSMCSRRWCDPSLGEQTLLIMFPSNAG